jgi:peptide/nickel transport system ATP-binding protein
VIVSDLLKITNLKIEAVSENSIIEIVKGIDLTLARGEVLGLIGESGAGKSTIGLAAMGYCRPGCKISSGTIIFDGIDVTAASQEQKQRLRGSRIAYVAQSAAAAFNPTYKLIHQYAEIPLLHKMMDSATAEKNAKHIYKQLLLPDPDNIGYRYPHQVSGGQLQRAMVAMAMACKPDIIVFDEPTTALDVTTQIEVLAAIKKVTREFNMAALYITHDLAVVIQLADRIMVLQHGGKVEEGSARQILETPKELYTQQLMAVRKFRKDPIASSGDDEIPILEIKGVTARYRRRQPDVLKDIDLKVTKGKTIAIVGESGSGKTTLAKAIIGLLPPQQGQILFKGNVLPKALKNRMINELQHIQMIYQLPDIALNPKQRIRSILGRPLKFYFGMGRVQQEKRIKELLNMVELPHHYLNRFPDELSGGEKQRICIARALAAEPDVIICDEVTSALDQLVAEEVLKLLQRLQDELNVTYLFITHDLATVKAIADEIVVMLLGSIVEQGPKETILSPPHHEYTELLLSSVPEMKVNWLDDLLVKRKQKSIA